MKAVDPALAHAQTNKSPFIVSSEKRPLDDVIADVITDEEDFIVEEPDWTNHDTPPLQRSEKGENGLHSPKIENGDHTLKDENGVHSPKENGIFPVNVENGIHPHNGDSGIYIQNGENGVHSLKEDSGVYILSKGENPWSNNSRPTEVIRNVINNGLVNGAPKVEGDLGKTMETTESPIPNWDRTVAEMKEHAFARLQDELKSAHQELKLRDEEVTRLTRIRQDVEAELEDLTASLFQEAHNMVREANVKQAGAERAFKESQMQVEVLTAEVAALKTLVLTSTPSKPNPHLHPQIDLRGNRTKDDSSLGGAGSLFNKKHRRSPSHFNLKYGRENSPPDSPVKEAQPPPADTVNCKEGLEVDPEVHRDFTNWRQNPKVDKSDPFIARIYKEEIDLCLDFPNKELSTQVRSAVESGNIFIEAVSDKTKTVFPKKCALLDVPRQCHYRMKFGDQEQWYCMSQICRNRIIAVCDFLNYLKYIERGLVKSSAHDVYWEVTRLRKDMVLARLGLALAS